MFLTWNANIRHNFGFKQDILTDVFWKQNLLKIVTRLFVAFGREKGRGKLGMKYVKTTCTCKYFFIKETYSKVQDCTFEGILSGRPATLCLVKSGSYDWTWWILSQYKERFQDLFLFKYHFKDLNTRHQIMGLSCHNYSPHFSTFSHQNAEK